MTDQDELLDIYGVPRTLRDAPPTIRCALGLHEWEWGIRVTDPTGSIGVSEPIVPVLPSSHYLAEWCTYCGEHRRHIHWDDIGAVIDGDTSRIQDGAP